LVKTASTSFLAVVEAHLLSVNPDFARVARSGQGEVRKSCEERVGTSC
jgi:hypothetical protein